MATTSLWKVSSSLKKVLDYAENPDKTSLKNALHYAADEEKKILKMNRSFLLRGSIVASRREISNINISTS